MFLGTCLTILILSMYSYRATSCEEGAWIAVHEGVVKIRQIEALFGLDYFLWFGQRSYPAFLHRGSLKSLKRFLLLQVSEFFKRVLNLGKNKIRKVARVTGGPTVDFCRRQTVLTRLGRLHFLNYRNLT